MISRLKDFFQRIVPQTQVIKAVIKEAQSGSEEARKAYSEQELKKAFNCIITGGSLAGAAAAVAIDYISSNDKSTPSSMVIGSAVGAGLGMHLTPLILAYPRTSGLGAAGMLAYGYYNHTRNSAGQNTGR